MKFYRYVLHIEDGVPAKSEKGAIKKAERYLEELAEQNCLGSMLTVEEISEKAYYETNTGNQDPYEYNMEEE